MINTPERIAAEQVAWWKANGFQACQAMGALKPEHRNTYGATWDAVEAACIRWARDKRVAA